jgi:predicted phosphoribosyltransferase
MYIDNQLLHNEICRSIEQNKFTDTANDMFTRLAVLIMRKIHYPDIFRKCAIGYAIAESERMLKHYKVDNTILPNYAFNFSSEVIKRSIANFYRKLNKK